jgi:hypothetical protein
LAQDWQKGSITLPSLEILTATTLNGAYAGYASGTNTIYLSEEFLSENPLSAITSILLEEFGHSLDVILNNSDSSGDEGQIFSALVQGLSLPESELQALKQENDYAFILVDGQEILIEQGSISDSGGFEGSYQVITLDTNGGGYASFDYEHYTIPDNFIIRYEGRNILETGFVGGSKTGTVQIPEGDSDQLEIIVATNDEGTAWNYTVETIAPGLNIQDAYVAVAGGSNQTATIKFPVILSEAVDVEVTVNYFTLVGTAVDGVTGNDRIDYRPITGTLTFAPGETSKEVEITVLGDTPVNYGGNANFEIFARDTAYRDWTKGQDIDFNGSLSYGDLGYRVDRFFNDGGTGFQATGLTSDENFFVLISNPVNSDISKDSDQEKARLLTDLEEFLGSGFATQAAYQKAIETLNNLEAQDTSWAYATGTIYDEGKAPVLAIRGTQPDQLKTDVWDDANPNGIGYSQFTANRGGVNQWLEEISQPEDDLSLKPHITGHSLGGALTQWVAADYSSQVALGDIVTFNAPGISTSAANSFSGAEKVTHYITSIDIVSMAGFRYISGQYVLSNQLLVPSSFPNPIDAHLHPVIIPKVKSSGLTKPSGLGIDTVGSTNTLSSAFFTYLPDPDYFAIQVIIAGLGAITPIPGATTTGAYVASVLTFRGTTEINRQLIGAVIYGIDYAIEFAKASVQAAWNAAKQWSTAAWNAITEWGENAWGAAAILILKKNQIKFSYLNRELV